MALKEIAPDPPGNRLFAIFAVATFIVVILGAHSYFFFSFTGELHKLPDQLLRICTGWYLWAAFFPFVLYLARNFPFVRGSRIKTVAIHVAFGAGIALVHLTLQTIVHEWLLFPQGDWNRAKQILIQTLIPGFVWRFFVYQSILTVSIALDSYHRARQTEEQASRVEASILHTELDSLKVRIDPDFLFQSLDQLSKMMHQDLDEADVLVARLGDYLRMRLDHSGRSETLQEEIELLRCYLEIENIKTQNRVQVEFDVDQESLGCTMPGMILQAAVEDALSSRMNQETLDLKISANKTESILVVNIQTLLLRFETPKLSPLVERLNTLYKTPVRMHCSTFSSGMLIRLEIPVRLEKREQPEKIEVEPEAEKLNAPDANPVKKWVAITAVFTLLAVYFTIQRLLIHSTKGTTINWPQHLLDYTGWYIWALITPIVLKISATYPIQQRNLFKHAAIHLFAFVGTWMFASAVHEFVKWTGNLFEYSLLERMQATLAGGSFYLDIICYSTIVAVETALRYHKRFEFGKVRTIRLNGQLARARLETLKMQLHPHFLFNSLNSLSELMQEDSRAAEEMIRNLETFLRLTMKHDHAQETLLEQELEFLKCYLAIENVRYQDRLNVKIEIEPQALKILVPSLVLQPIVENAIRHGIAPRKTPGEIEIRATRKNGVLQVSVRDNGPGLSKTKRKEATPRSGLGLSNTRERLIQLYGNRHRFELVNSPEGGLIVGLEIPVSTSTES